jgi:hypothetical protein
LLLGKDTCISSLVSGFMLPFDDMGADLTVRSATA